MTRPPDASPTTHERIRSAAVELFATQGFAATGIRDIARTAGVATSVLYHYVSAKDQLLNDIMTEGLTSVINVASHAVNMSSEPADRLARLVITHMYIEVTHAQTSAVIDQEFRATGETLRDEVRAYRRQYEQIWIDVLRSGNLDKSFRCGDERLSVLFLIDLCNGVKRWYRPGGRLTIAVICAGAVDAALSIVRAERNGAVLTHADLDVDVAAFLDHLDSSYAILRLPPDPQISAVQKPSAKGARAKADQSTGRRRSTAKSTRGQP